MATVTDLRQDAEALAAFVRSWEFDPIAAGKPWGLRWELRDGRVMCSRVYASKASAERANTRRSVR
jgi:hypothetical protein